MLKDVNDRLKVLNLKLKGRIFVFNFRQRMKFNTSLSIFLSDLISGYTCLFFVVFFFFVS